MQAPKPGEILLGKYRVEEIIGVGGMGRVVKASHLYLQQPVAIKILRAEKAENTSTVARFLREAQATVRLRSEHIARVMDVGTMPDGCPFMVMEFLEGQDLNQILRQHGPQPSVAVVDFVLQACEGLAEAHASGIVHRDIKPSNFFITRRPDGSPLLKILDFGISKTAAELTDLTGSQTVIGTPTYMAPEQMMSARSTDPRSDVWSIGVVAYQLLEGRPPFEAETYAQLVLMVGTLPPNPLRVVLPPGLPEIVLRCLEKDPNRRIQSVGELARVLAPYASDPIAAQQSADRTSRILAGTRGGPLVMTNTVDLPFAPPVAAPRNWSNTGGSSLSGSAGQVGTSDVRRSTRAYVIAGVASLCTLAGVGGFFIASSMNDDRTPAASETRHEIKLAPSTAPATGPASPPHPDANPTQPEPATPEPAQSEAAQPEPAKSDATKREPSLGETRPADAKKTSPKKPTKKKRNDDLFDDRK